MPQPAAAPAATDAKKATACKAEGWLANLSEAERTAFKNLGWCPEDHLPVDLEKSPFATPIDLEIGPKVTLKGAQIFPKDARHFFTTVDVDALWSPGSNGTYQSTASIRPTYSGFQSIATLLPSCVAKPDEVLTPPTIPGSSWQVYGDLRQRVGDFPKTGTTTTNETVRVRQILLGAGVDYRVFTYRLRDLERRTRADHEYPRLALTYYTVRDHSETKQDVPPELTTDKIQLAFTAEIPIPIVEGDTGGLEKLYQDYFPKLLAFTFCKGPDPGAEPKPTGYYPWSFSFDLRASRPTTGDTHKMEKYADVALKYLKPGAKVGYVARYRTGKDLGFDYKDELLIGLLMRLVK
ncbi:MAG TPA: hypothetical protein VGQ65_25570 [Thermoanaerobaculia bacterium]|nr:hypothetical protein [Thermoanaerobaculia bacterium]